MGNSVDDIPWPKRAPRQPKPPADRPGCGKKAGTIAGISLFLFIAVPVLVGYMIGKALGLG